MKKILNTQGFTLAELIIAMGLLGILLTSAIGVYSAFFGSLRNVRAANHIYEETNNVMERMMKEIRLNTVDYDEYFNKFVSNDCYPTTASYGLATCAYNEQFYSVGGDTTWGTDDDISLGKNKDASIRLIDDPLACDLGDADKKPIYKRAIDLSTQDQLILTSGDGYQKKIIKKIEEDYGCTSNCTYQIGILELVGTDTAPFDGHADSWACKEGYKCEDSSDGIEAIDKTNPLNPKSSFVPISPKTLNILELKFIIAPADDPLKSYNDSTVQVQPFVTLKLKAEASPKITTEFREEKRPEISLESMITTKLHQEVHRYCFQ